ncbi:DeoR/GlpR family DNA-binding transcription regulator [Bartonella sp. LJL80]
MTESSHELTERQREIISMITRDGYCPLEKLALHFNVSTQSVRRDVVFLDSIGLVQRFHGGAGSLKQFGRSHYSVKQNEAVKAKQKIAQKACSLLQAGDVVFIDVGTTTETLARALSDLDLPLTVFTSSISAAAILAGNDLITLNIPGGFIRSIDGAIVGSQTVQALEAFRFNLSFIAFSGFDPDGALTDFDLEKIAVKQAAMRRSERSIALGDKRKFTRNALGKIAALQDFSTIITDSLPAAIEDVWRNKTQFIQTDNA